jgi:amino acid adenylation domain-containing protein
MSKSIELINNPGTSITEYEKFWAERIADLQPLTIPYATPTAGQKKEFVELMLSIPDELFSLLQEYFSNVKQADILLTAFVCYLARISGTVSFDIGFTDAELIQKIGNLDGFADRLPCRIEIDLAQNLAEIIEVVRGQIESAKQHQSYASDIVTRYPALDLVPGIHDGQLFPVIIERISDLDHLKNNPTASMAGRDLTLIVPDQGKVLCWRYNPEVFDADTISRMANQFETLLQNLVAEPQKPLAYQSLLPQDELHKILWEWNKSEVDFSQDKCLHQLFEEQVIQTPDAVAVVFEDQQLTYQELNEQANQLAHYLHSLGVVPETLVGICVERSLFTAIGLIGILKAGGAYVPLDPSYPQDRIAYSISDSQIAVLLTNQKHLTDLPENKAQLVCLDRDWQTIAANSTANPVNNVKPANLAYVIYTSGTTGKPKGVLIEHHNVCRLFAATQPWYNFNSTDVWTMFHSYAFDFSVWEFWGALLYGGKLVVVPYITSRSPDRFYQLLIDEGVTVLNQTPSAFAQLIQIDERQNLNSQLNLRLVIFGGEALEIQSLKPWFERHGDRQPQLVNMYGITETTVHVTYRPIAIADTERQSSVIGCPIPDLKIYLLDRYLQPSPIGTIGEMYVGGSGLARGYLNRPELTQERFIPSPFNAAEKLYKTGDLARYSLDGEIEYLGRSDNQVKIRGFRIELGEIEAVLALHPEVRQNVVIVREDTPGDKRLVAYVVGQSAVNLTVEKLREVLKQKLPDYMVPTAFVQLEALPLTANGKVDRRALPVPHQLLQDSAEIIPPRSELESKLVKIWQDVLGKDAISVTANFFDLGGHSLMAVSLLTQIEATFDKNLSLGTFLGTPTIEGVAEVLSQEASSGSNSLLFPIRTTGSKPPLFLINAVGTGMLAYKLLAKYLDPEQPIYGVRAVGMDDQRSPHNRIGEMAEAYIHEIRTIQPQGSYWLAGLCTGGTVAFEMAQRLISQGFEIRFLALIDSTARPILTKSDSPTEAENNDHSSATLFDRYIKHNFALRGVNNLFGIVTNPQLKLKDKISFAAEMGQQLYKKTKDKFEVLAYNNQTSQNLPYPLRRSRVYEAGIEALLHHTPTVYEGDKVILFRAPDNPEHVEQNYQLGWDEFVTGELEVHEVLGDQTTMLFEPHIKILAAKLNSCLNNVSLKKS